MTPWGYFPLARGKYPLSSLLPPSNSNPEDTMTVAELIAHLQTLPQDLPVILGCGTSITGTNQVDFNAHFGADPDSPNDPVVIIG